MLVLIQNPPLARYVIIGLQSVPSQVLKSFLRVISTVPPEGGYLGNVLSITVLSRLFKYFVRYL
jgi:hypothetical protein